MKTKFFDLAEKVSKNSDHPHHKMGAVVARGNKLISVAHNQYRTHPKSNTTYKYVHAEMRAILNARGDTKGADIYVFRKNKLGELAIAKPCEHCMELIAEAGIKNIFYTDTNSYLFYELG